MGLQNTTKLQSLLKPNNKALLSGAASSHVAKRTRSTMYQSSKSITRPSLFSIDSDEESGHDGDAYDWGKAIMIDADVAPTEIVGHFWPATASAPSFKDDPSIFKTAVDQFPTHGEMVRIKALTDDRLNAKISILYYHMMSHGGELLAWYMGLLKSYAYVQSADSKLKNLKESCASFSRLEFQIFGFQKPVADLNTFAKSKVKDELLSLAASAGFERGLRMHQIPKEFVAVLKKSSQFLPGAQNRLIKAGSLLEPEKLARSVNVPTLKDTRTFPPVMKELTVVLVSFYLELPPKAAPSSSTATNEQNEEWINVMVDVPDNKITGDAGNGKPMEVEKYDGSLPSSGVAEETAAAPAGV
nr:hypothetical protein [Tanacetum cinerariifolium]